MPSAPHRFAATALALAALVAARAAGADVCPDIEDEYRLCSEDLLSGNCRDFVRAADELGALFRSRAAANPGQELPFTSWWGCGPDDLGQVADLLRRTGLPGAMAVLASEPYRSLQHASGAAPGPRAPGVIPDCENLPSPTAQRDCAKRELDAASAEHRRAVEACGARLGPDLQPGLAQAEDAWKAQLPERCHAVSTEYALPALEDFANLQCLAQATRERTQAIFAAYPQCGGGS
jgi:uncharacterized protein YecT (DUF1311 family)